MQLDDLVILISVSVR